jgi:hypothetical protein
LASDLLIQDLASNLLIQDSAVICELFETAQNIVTRLNFLVRVLGYGVDTHRTLPGCYSEYATNTLPGCYSEYATNTFIGGFIDRVLTGGSLLDEAYLKDGKAMLFLSRLLVCSNELKLFDREVFDNLYLRSVGFCFEIFPKLLDNSLGQEALVNYSKIPSDTERRLACLKAVFHALNPSRRSDDFSLGALFPIARQGDIGLDALLTCSRIPGDTGRQFACLEAVFNVLNPSRRPSDFGLGALFPIARQGDIGLDALLTCSRIPGDKGREFACLEAVFHALNPSRRLDDFSLGALLLIARQGDIGLDALVTYSRIPGDARRQLACWEACATARFGDRWYSHPKWIVDDEILSECFANITGTRYLRPEFGEGREVGRFQNGHSVSAFYHNDAWYDQ